MIYMRLVMRIMFCMWCPISESIISVVDVFLGRSTLRCIFSIFSCRLDILSTQGQVQKMFFKILV